MKRLQQTQALAPPGTAPAIAFQIPRRKQASDSGFLANASAPVCRTNAPPHAHPLVTDPSPFNWRGTPSVIGAQLKPSNKDRSAGARPSQGFAIEGREVGQQSTDNRAALRRGGI
jgi:hypothetical protein